MSIEQIPAMRSAAEARSQAEAIFSVPDRVSFDSLIGMLTELQVMVGQAQLDPQDGDLRMIGASLKTATRHAKLLAGKPA